MRYAVCPILHDKQQNIARNRGFEAEYANIDNEAENSDLEGFSLDRKIVKKKHGHGFEAVAEENSSSGENDEERHIEQ